eukprot:Rhum_TRINITY_DN14798_c4_g1::Rhum_TRINITY_DN14798_c4_g1_i1::g.110984::m.110984/K11341/YEATS4, GAS41, YAF9; YEATS domain-containing protein 4
MGKRGSGTAPSSARAKKERLADDSFSLPVVFGCAAEPAGVRQYDGRDVDWMSWRVYVRALEKRPLSAFVKKVRMVLHPTIPHPTRDLTAEPYETEGEGYGEFFVSVELVLREDVFHEAVSIKLSQTNLRLRAPEETAHTMPGGGGNGPEYVTATAASAQLRAEGGNAKKPVITECLDTVLVTPLAEAAESIEAAWAKFKKGRAAQPRALGLLKKVPAWLLDEDRHVRRYEEVAAGVAAKTVELEAATERLRWRRATALQRQDRLKRLLEDEEAKAAAAAKRRRCEGDESPSGGEAAGGGAAAAAAPAATAAAGAGDASPAAL